MKERPRVQPNHRRKENNGSQAFLLNFKLF